MSEQEMQEKFDFLVKLFILVLDEQQYIETADQ